MNRPILLKGGFVYYESGASAGKVITFQYNPELLKRTITPIEGCIQPKETIKFTLELDAADALEHAEQTAASLGLYPALSALELLVQPREYSLGFFGNLFSWFWGKNNSFVLFVWGAQRVIPVRVLELIISEQMFDPLLNPIRVSIDVTMETLTEEDLKSIPNAKPFMDSYRSNKEMLARQSGSSGTAEDLLKDGRS